MNRRRRHARIEERRLVAENDLLFPEMTGSVQDSRRASGSERALERYLKKIDVAAAAWVPPLTSDRALYLSPFFRLRRLSP